jgi:hypothetical protein
MKHFDDHPPYDDGESDPARLYPLLSVIIAEDDANDPGLDSYQMYAREPRNSPKMGDTLECEGS